jgi:D-alanyl-D-alanine dipeptidase
MLVEIVPQDDILLDLKYAGADNIAGRALYAKPLCLLHAEAARALQRAAGFARAQGLKLLVFDAYRPVEAQRALWEACPDPTYVADPRRGSHHARGVAVDLALVEAGSGVALDMGTGFDEMSALSHHVNAEIPQAAQRHRMLLLGLMTLAGFTHDPHEWWHYQLPNAASYPFLKDGEAGPPLMS